jgi:HEAT repeat protein
MRPLNQPGWAEVWPFVAGILRENPAIIEALEIEVEACDDILSSRLRLLADCLGEFLGCLREQTTEQVRFKALGERTMESVLDLIAQEQPVTSQPFTWRSCLARLPANWSIPRLVDRISKSEGYQGPDSYAVALGDVGTADARDELKRIISDPKTHEIVRANAAVGLGLVGDAEARDALLFWLDESLRTRKKLVHYGCVSGLALVADQPARQALARLLKAKTEPDVRLDCVRRCEHLFGSEIEAEMLQCAERCARMLAGQLATGGNQSEHDLAELNVTVANCAEVLGRIGGPDSARRLFKLLRAKLSITTKARICDAIASCGDVASRQELRKMVMNPATDRPLSILAALSLIRKGDEDVLTDLLQVSSSDQLPESLREAAAEACADVVSPKVDDFLADRLLHDSSSRVKLAAAKSLARRQSGVAGRAMKDGMGACFRADVRFECVVGRALQGDSDAVETLIEVLKDKHVNAAKRGDAAKALGRVEDASARAALRAVLESESEEIGLRFRCKHVLETVQRVQGWRPLEHGGWDPP